VFIRFDVIHERERRTDRQRRTDRRTLHDSINRACIASRGKNDVISEKLQFHFLGELGAHLVERMYLRQRCFNGSVNKTILILPRLDAAAGRQYKYVGFSVPDVKFRLAAIIRYRRKQSGSGIRTIIRIGLKS